MFIWINNGKLYKTKVYMFFLYLDKMDDFWLILKTILKITTFCGFSLIYLFSGLNILKVFFKSNSLSINKKNHINIKYSLLNKLHFDRNILHEVVKKTQLCTYIKWLKWLKMIRRFKWLNPPAISYPKHKNN